MTTKACDKSHLDDLPNKLPVLIIGGGIAGAGVFRDLALHGIPCALIDKKDFTSQTSQSSSKMLHGGIRYLENLDFHLVWEALHEKNLWLELAPHLTYPEKFYLPVYNDALRPLWMVRMGLFLYDALSSFKNIPHEVANVEKTLERFPYLKSQGLTGAGVYSDAVMDDAKITLECIYDGLLEDNTFACNHTSIVSAQKKGQSYLVTLRDELKGHERQIETDHLIFTTGPFTDKLLNELNLFTWKPKLMLSRGSHLWFDNNMLKANGPMVLTPKDGRVIFVIPQKDKTLVGTTEVPGSATFDQSPSNEEKEYLYQNLRDYFPKAEVGDDALLGQFAGVRPLVKEDPDANLGKVARNHKVYQPLENTYVLLGGKYTTFRVMAQDVVSPLLHKMGLAYRSDLSERPLRKRSRVLPWQNFELNDQLIRDILDEEFPKTMDDLLYRRLGQTLTDYSSLKDQVSSILERNHWKLA